MTELWLVRHGQTDWNLEKRYQGQADIPLNLTGLQQAADLANRLEGEAFEALYSSDLSRARQTAELLARTLGLPLRLDARLREIHQGEWQGEYLDDVRERHTLLLEEHWNNPARSRAPGGESVIEVAGRAAQAISEICRRHPRGRVLVVSHGLTLATLICQARSASLARVYSLIPENTQVEVIYWPPVRPLQEN
ncbi:MAG TPA: histidine phosphatase family protein [Anaerolineaceae bacterium]|nr:histidine phosphatase family protein [Anaerolineaceae bacterium]HQH84779.1 histidine phosphatase family protein [Anaerolineaceae bacterium]